MIKCKITVFFKLFQYSLPVCCAVSQGEIYVNAETRLLNDLQ
jgi:hypothetical protein